MIFVKLYSVIFSGFFVLLSTVFTFTSLDKPMKAESCITPKKQNTEVYKEDSIRSAHMTDSLLTVIEYKCNKVAKQQNTIKKQQAEILAIAKLQ